MKKILLIAASVLVLSGCVKIYEQAEKADAYVKNELLKVNAHLLALMEEPKPESTSVIANGDGVGATEQPAYCYKTWAKVDCYKHQVKKDNHRLSGYVGPRPTYEGMEPAAFSAGSRDPYGNINALMPKQEWVTEKKQAKTMDSASPKIKKSEAQKIEEKLYAEESEEMMAGGETPIREKPKPRAIRTLLNQ